jgi:hypothetical protein
MENDIDLLGATVSTRPEWSNVIGALRHEWMRDDMKETAVSLNKAIYYLGEQTSPGVHGYHAGDNDFDLVLTNLRSQISHLYRTFDDSSFSSVFTLPETINFLQSGFLYSNAPVFKQEEKDLIQRALTTTYHPTDIPETAAVIPEVAWNKFWQTVDSCKMMMATEIDRYRQNPSTFRDSRFFRDLFLRYSKPALIAGSINFQPMSPFNWSKVLFMSVGGTLSAVNAAIALPTAGVGLASVIAGVIASSIASGIS